VTWSYSNSYVGWAPLPPTVTFGASGYSGGAIVVGASQYVFVPTNRFVGVNVGSVRVPTLQNATIFRQTTHATRFSVSGGILRNMAIPVSAIQRAGVRVETRAIADARTSPRPMMSAGSGRRGRFNVVAPAREVNAAFKSRGNDPSHSARHGSAEAQEGSRPSHESHASPGHAEHKSARPPEREPSAFHDGRERHARQGRSEPPPSEIRRRSAPADHSSDAPSRAQPGPHGHDAAASPGHSANSAAVHGKGKKTGEKGKNDKDKHDRKD